MNSLAAETDASAASWASGELRSVRFTSALRDVPKSLTKLHAEPSQLGSVSNECQSARPAERQRKGAALVGVAYDALLAVLASPLALSLYSLNALGFGSGGSRGRSLFGPSVSHWRM